MSPRPLIVVRVVLAVCRAIVITVVALIAIGPGDGAGSQQPTATPDAQAVYWCPMHPDIRGGAADKCPQVLRSVEALREDTGETLVFVTHLLELSPATIADRDAVLVATDHDAVDYRRVAGHARLIVDTRNVFARSGIVDRRIIKA